MIHHDLLGAIFAYSRLSKRLKFSKISRQSWRACHSHTYIISLGENNIRQLFDYAYSNNKIQATKYCLKNPRISWSNDDLRVVVEYGYVEIARLLLANPHIDPGENDNYLIRLASAFGYVEIVQLLLADPRVDPSNDSDYPIILHACRGGHYWVVKALLADARVDPSANNNQAIEVTLRKGNRHLDIANLLLSDSRVANKITPARQEELKRLILEFGEESD